MNFNEQVKWIENKITELEKAREHNEDLTKKTKSNASSEAQAKIANELQSEINALTIILHDYKKAKKDSVNLGWLEYPDGMGR